MKFAEWLVVEMAAARSAYRMYAKSLDPNLAVGFVTACRNGIPFYTYTEQPKDGIRKKHPRKRTAMDDLAKNLLMYGWGIVKTIGGYKEDDENNVIEPSFMVAKYTNDPPETIIKQLLALVKPYEQNGVIVKLPGQLDAYEYKGVAQQVVPYETPIMQNSADNYTKLRKGVERKMTYPAAYTKPPSPLDPEKPLPPV